VSNDYKKLSCRRETARRFVSINIFLSFQGHSRSFEMTVLSKSLLVFHCPFATMSVSRTVSAIFSISEWRDLETGSRGSFNVIENGAVR